MSLKTNLIQDLSLLTTIEENKLKHLMKLSLACISEEFNEMVLNGDTDLSYDIGIGTLMIGLRNNEVKYKFVPADILGKNLDNILKGKQNLLEAKIEKQLAKAIENIYKDLM